VGFFALGGNWFEMESVKWQPSIKFRMMEMMETIISKLLSIVWHYLYYPPLSSETFTPMSAKNFATNMPNNFRNCSLSFQTSMMVSLKLFRNVTRSLRARKWGRQSSRPGRRPSAQLCLRKRHNCPCGQDLQTRRHIYQRQPRRRGNSLQC
jgi:hypothetical protein